MDRRASQLAVMISSGSRQGALSGGESEDLYQDMPLEAAEKLTIGRDFGWRSASVLRYLPSFECGFSR